MSNKTNQLRLAKVAATAAIVAGLAAGSYGIANAASGGSGSGSSTAATTTATAPPANGGQPWGRQRGDETLLTGDTASKVRAAAQAKLPGATIVRVETDADGNALYEAHMIEADGTPATVYVDKDFAIVSIETR
jgi:hypothetical protein